MSTIDWPAGFAVSGFSLSVKPNTRTFTSAYSRSTQVLDLGGEDWSATVTMPVVSRHSGQAQQLEAFFDRLAGGVNLLRLWHIWNPEPRGTFADAPVAFAWTDSGSPWTWTDSASPWAWTDGTLALLAAVTAGAQTCTFASRPGRTAFAGDMVGVAGELKRITQDATADGAGNLAVSFTPRARENWAAYSAAIVTTRPTTTFRLLGDVPTPWAPGSAGGASFELIEDLT